MVFSKADQSLRISRKIKELRDERKWTQAKLAERAGVTGAAISKIESEAGRIPTIVVLRKLAAALEVTVDEITGEVAADRSERDERATSFYRRWGVVEQLPEEDQQRLLDMAERLKEISKK